MRGNRTPPVAGVRGTGASGLFRSIVAERYYEQMMAWLEARADEPAEWQQAALFGDLLARPDDRGRRRPGRAAGQHPGLLRGQRAGFAVLLFSPLPRFRM